MKIHFACVVVCQAEGAEQSWSFLFGAFVCRADGVANIWDIILGSKTFIPLAYEYGFKWQKSKCPK